MTLPRVFEAPDPTVHRSVATVLSVEPHSPGAVRALVRPGAEPGDATGPDAWALAYTRLVGVPAAGDRVLLNTTAIDLRLGTGGYHFVIAILGRSEAGETEESSHSGHLMKLRYTPHQCRVLAAEEAGFDDEGLAGDETDLEGSPVVVCELHSQVAAVAAGFLARRPGSRVAYIMTDSGALPAWVSKLLPALREAGLVHGVITAGQACGGDLEAINVYSALLVARRSMEADLIVVGQGPGNAGTGTRFGFSGIAQGEAANAAASLGGQPVVCLRASSADPRERHRTPSHHTLTVLDRVVRCRCVVAIARDASASRRRDIMAALTALDLHVRHQLLSDHRGAPGLDLLRRSGVEVTTMGRTVEQDREFFLHASAAGEAAAAMLEFRTPACLL